MTATITNIQLSGSNFIVSVHYADPTGFAADNQFSYPADGTATQAKVQADIIAQGNIYKSNLITLNNIQTKVGTVITI